MQDAMVVHSQKPAIPLAPRNIVNAPSFFQEQQPSAALLRLPAPHAWVLHTGTHFTAFTEYSSIPANRNHGFDPTSKFLSKIVLFVGLLYHIMAKETYFQRKNPAVSMQFLTATCSHSCALSDSDDYLLCLKKCLLIHEMVVQPAPKAPN
jgi:hypothetical protein